MESQPTLHQKFLAIQEETERRAKLRLEKKEKEKQNSASGNKQANNNDVYNVPSSATFGVPDDMKLTALQPPPDPRKAYLSEELVDHLNDQIREGKDENGRLRKLLSEREFEIKMLKKKLEEEKARGGFQVTNETAATKIVDLSKKVRELTAELESEKTRCKQWQKKCQDLQQQALQFQGDGSSMMGSVLSLQTASEEKAEGEVDVKGLQDRLKQTESKLAEYRNQTMALKQELKVANKVLVQELGEGVTFQSLLGANSNWRGRAQTIRALQMKLDEARSQIEVLQGRNSSQDSMESSRMSGRRKTQDDKYKDELRRIEKERKEALERASSDYKSLTEEHENLKQKFDGLKARNKVLSGEIKSLKQQMQTLISKGHHDDELIEALMKQQEKLKRMMESSTLTEEQAKQQQQQRLKELSMKQQQDNNVVEQLKAIVADREAKVKALEVEIQQIKRNRQASEMEMRAKSAMSDEDEPAYGEENVVPFFEVAPSYEIRAQSGSSRSGVPRGSSGNPSPNKPPTPALSMQGRPLSSAANLNHSNPVVSNGLGMGSRPGSTVSTLPEQGSLVADLQYQCQEFRILMQAAEVERDRLAELVKMQEKRMAEAVAKYNEAQSDLMMHKRKCVQLEKQLGRSALKDDKGGDRKSSSKAGNMSSRETPAVLDDEDEATSAQEILVNLEIQQDENQALKAALQSTLQAKEEDLRLYQETMEETKKVFLQALRQLRQNAHAAS